MSFVDLHFLSSVKMVFIVSLLERILLVRQESLTDLHFLQSDDFLELGQVGPRTEVTLGTSHGQSNTPNSMPATGDGSSNNTQKSIIHVKSTVTQTYSDI